MGETFIFEEIKISKQKDAEFVKFDEIGKSIEGFLSYVHFQKSKKKGFSDNYTYFLDDPSWDKRKGINGSGQLNYKMSKVAIGDRVRITYLGKEEISNLPQPIHSFKVEIGKK